MNALIANARFHFHERLFETNTLTLTKAGVASNADTSSRGSKAIAGKIVDILVDEHHHTVATVYKGNIIKFNNGLPILRRDTAQTRLRAVFL